MVLLLQEQLLLCDLILKANIHIIPFQFVKNCYFNSFAATDAINEHQQVQVGTERLQEKAGTTEEELGRCHQTGPPTDGLDLGRSRGAGE